MTTPAILPSYIRTVLETERAQASQATTLASVVQKSQKKGAIQVRRKSWLRKRLPAAFRTFGAVSRRVLAAGGTESE